MSISYKWRAVIVCIGGTFMVVLDTTIVNVALPSIMAAFNENIDKVQLIVSGYLIAMGLVIPATGFLGDRLGMKRVYILSLAGFLLGSVLSAFAWDVSSLTLFRIIQGIGGGMLIPLTMTIIFVTVPRQEQGFVMGIYGIPTLLAPTIGPTLGGYLIERLDWRVIFYMNVPVGILAIWITQVWLRDTPHKASLPFDYKGFLLAALSFGPSLLALSRAPTWGWSAPLTVGLLSISFAALIAWVLVELKEPYPLLELRIFKNRLYSVATLVSFVTTFGLFSAMFLLPVFLQNLRGLGPMETGILMVPQALGTLVAMPLSGRIYDKIGARLPVVGGLVLVGLATLQMRFLDLTTSDAQLGLMLVLRGLGMGMAMMPVMTAAMAAVPKELTSRASALTNVSRQVFASFGTAVFATFIQQRQTFHFAAMSQTVTPDSVTTITALSSIQQGFVRAGLAWEDARHAAIASLHRLVELRAAVQSFDDAFVISGVVLLIGIVPSLFLTGIRPARKGGPRPME